MYTVLLIFYAKMLFFRVFFGLDGFENEILYKNVQLFYSDDIDKSEANSVIRLFYEYYLIEVQNKDDEIYISIS